MRILLLQLNIQDILATLLKYSFLFLIKVYTHTYTKLFRQIYVIARKNLSNLTFSVCHSVSHELINHTSSISMENE